MDDTRTFEELSGAEQRQLVEWIDSAFFPTTDGGITLAEIAEEVFFLTDRPSVLWPGTDLHEIWEPGWSAIHTAMQHVGWIKQRQVTQWRGEPIMFYSVKLYYRVLPELEVPTGKMLRDRYDWSVAPLAHAEARAITSNYTWTAMR